MIYSISELGINKRAYAHLKNAAIERMPIRIKILLLYNFDVNAMWITLEKLSGMPTLLQKLRACDGCCSINKKNHSSSSSSMILRFLRFPPASACGA
jgi:hypothetical protein